MKISIYHSILLALVLFKTVAVADPQLLNNVSHVIENITEQKPPSNPPSSSTPPQSSPPPPPPPAQTTNNTPTSSSSQAPAPTQSSSNPPTTSQKPSENTPPPATSNSPTTPSSPTTSNNPATPNDNSVPASPSSTSTSSGGVKHRTKAANGEYTAIDTTLPSTTTGVIQTGLPNKSNSNSSSGNKTGVIVGAVVGSIFGIALLGGILTWINRHGGCARRSNKRSADFEDYGLADTDFPINHQQSMRSPAMQSVGISANASTIGGATPIVAAVTPTIPRLNDQGAYYSGATEDPYNNQHQYYQPQLDANGNVAPVVDYSNPQPIMDYSQQQSYYYQQPQDTQNVMSHGYYDESGYYYDNQQQPIQNITGHSPNPSYDINAPYNPTYLDQSSYPPTAVGDHYYKPDQVDVNHHQRM